MFSIFSKDFVIYIYIHTHVNYGTESDSMEKIEKPSNQKAMNLLWNKVNVKTFRF